MVMFFAHRVRYGYVRVVLLCSYMRCSLKFKHAGENIIGAPRSIVKEAFAAHHNIQKHLKTSQLSRLISGAKAMEPEACDSAAKALPA